MLLKNIYKYIKHDKIMKLKNYVIALGIGVASFLPYKANAQLPADYQTHIALSPTPISDRQTFSTLEDAIAYVPPSPFDKDQVTITVYDGEYTGSAPNETIDLSNRIIIGSAKPMSTNPLETDMSLKPTSPGLRLYDVNFSLKPMSGLENLFLENGTVQVLEDNVFVRYNHLKTTTTSVGILAENHLTNSIIQGNVVEGYAFNLRILPSVGPDVTVIKDNVIYGARNMGVHCILADYFLLDTNNVMARNQLYNVYMKYPPLTIPAEFQMWTDKDGNILEKEEDILATIFVQSPSGAGSQSSEGVKTSESVTSGGATPQEIDVVPFLTVNPFARPTKAKHWEMYE